MTDPAAGPTLYLVDTSAWARVPREPRVAQRVRELHTAGQIVLATPVVLELGFSARTLDEWHALHDELGSFPVLPPTAATHGIAVGLQRALWANGRVRAAGAFDTLVAACAVEHDAVLVHYDRGYVHLAAVEPLLRHEWVVPAGSVS